MGCISSLASVVHIQLLVLKWGLRFKFHFIKSRLSVRMHNLCQSTQKSKLFKVRVGNMPESRKSTACLKKCCQTVEEQLRLPKENNISTTPLRAVAQWRHTNLWDIANSWCAWGMLDKNFNVDLKPLRRLERSRSGARVTRCLSPLSGIWRRHLGLSVIWMHSAVWSSVWGNLRRRWEDFSFSPSRHVSYTHSGFWLVKTTESQRTFPPFF